MLKENILIARGKKPADLLLKNASYINVFTGEIERQNIAIANGKIVGFGEYEAREEIDVAGQIVTPGLIDAHIHIESSQLVPTEFAKLVLAQGTTAIVADPHEIANVCGMDGIQFMIDSLKNTLLNFKMMLPSCVPATPFETTGAVLSGRDCVREVQKKDIAGLAEFMNIPALLLADEDACRKLQGAIDAQKIIDGHAPSVTGRDLNAYLVAGVRTDHECTTVNEAIEKVAKGMYILMREGSATQDVAVLCKAITTYTRSRFLFCTDDKHAEDIERIGHINHAVRVAIEAGLSPIDAIICATINAAICYGFYNKGAVAIGYDADLAVFDSLQTMRCTMTIVDGKVVAKNGKAIVQFKGVEDKKVVTSMHIQEVTASTFNLPCETKRARVIEVFAKTLFTEEKIITIVPNATDIVLPKGILKIAVLERHKSTGNIAVALLSGITLKNGAIAQTIAHDSHNCIVLGDNNKDMALAVNTLQKVGGGIAIVYANKVHTLPLEVAGLMTAVAENQYIAQMKKMVQLSKDLGVQADIDVFMTLSFMALPVIPKLKMTDKGLFDVMQFAYTKVAME